jgi:uncharacterized protein
MISRQLLSTLVCPEARQPLALADAPLLARLNAAITGGRVRTKAGQLVTAPLEGGLVRQDGAVLYPIVDDIPVMLVEESIPLDQLG